ncbi:MAG TPA: LPS assembly lipoprotein LptE [Patescibacteria group bacterium]|nr:LPS assembly lipoprotein LptE [Patescibacteria group bacterium]
MWSSRVVILLALLVAGCGFKPMYGEHAGRFDAADARESGIEVANIPDRDGQYLRNQLIDRLNLKGRPGNAPYLLTVSPLRTELTNLGIRKDATATRAMLQTSATMTLTERATGQVVLTRDVKAVGGYNQLDNQFATLVSKSSVLSHMLEEMADTITTEIGLFFNRPGRP